MTSHEIFNNHSHNITLHMDVSQWRSMNNIITTHIIQLEKNFRFVFHVCYYYYSSLQTACFYLFIYIMYIYANTHIYILTVQLPKNCSQLCLCSVILVIFVCKRDIFFCNPLHSLLTATDCVSRKTKNTSCSMEITWNIGVALWTDRRLVGSATPCSLL